MFIFSQSKWLVFISPQSTSSPTLWPLTYPCLLLAAACPALGCSWGAHGDRQGAPCHGIGVGAVPVCRYPWVGNHDGFQVEAPVAQIPAERRGRAMALGNSSTPSTGFPNCSTVEMPGIQTPVLGPRGNRHSQGSLAWQGWRGSHAQSKEGCSHQHRIAGSCSISMAGSRRCCFHF